MSCQTVNMSSLLLPEWSAYNNYCCYRSRCQLYKLNHGDNLYHCPRHKTGHVCEWVYNDVWGPDPRSHTYSGAKCPLVVQPGTEYIVCEMTGYVFDKQPVYLPSYEQQVATNNSPEAEVGPADTYDRLINYDDKTFSNMLLDNQLDALVMKMSFFMDTYYTENEQRLFFTHMITLFHELYPRERKKDRFQSEDKMYIYTAISDSVGSYYRDPAYSLKRVSKYRKYTNLVQNLKVICRAVKPMRPKNTTRE